MRATKAPMRYSAKPTGYFPPVEVTTSPVIASWYGTKFHGRLTSNGEVYNMYGMTAAHKSLPIPSYAKVTNIRKWPFNVVVRINDRGPFP